MIKKLVLLTLALFVTSTSALADVSGTLNYLKTESATGYLTAKLSGNSTAYIIDPYYDDYGQHALNGHALYAAISTGLTVNFVVNYCDSYDSISWCFIQKVYF